MSDIGPPPSDWDFLYEPPRPLSAGPAPAPTVRQPTLGQVSRLLENGGCFVAFPDGSEALCANRVFPGVRPEYTVIAYPDGDSGWSLHDPAWILPFHGHWTLPQLASVLSRRSGDEEGEQAGPLLEALRQGAAALLGGAAPDDSNTLDEKQCRQVLDAVSQGLKLAQQRAIEQCLKGYTCGDPVPFRITHADANDPAILHGTLLGEPAFTRREELPFPKCLPLYPVELLAQDTSFAWHLVDPISRPLRIARCLTGSLEYPTVSGQRHQKHPEPGLFLLALRALTRHRATLPAVVRMSDEEFVSLDIYGARLAVFPEQCRWDPDQRACDLFHEGQIVEVFLTIDPETFTIDTSLLPIDGPEWAHVVRDFPPGKLITDARYLLSNREGLIIDVPCPGLQVRGLIPFGELAEGNDPYSYYTDELDGTLTLRAIGHDTERRRLTLSWRQGMSSIWCGARLRPGQIIPVEVVVALPDAIWVRWAPGQLAEIRGDQPRKGCWWARVEEIDFAGRSLRLALHQPEEPFEVLAVGEETALARLGDSEITLYRRPPFDVLAPGQLIQPHVRSIVHRYSGPTIVAASANAYLELSKLEEGAIRRAVVQQRVKGGFQVDLESVRAFLPASQVDIRQPTNMDAIVGQEFDVMVLKVDAPRGNVVVSRRQLLEQERGAQKEQLLREVAPGQVRKGVVKNIADYGAFIDLGGLDGLMHITDMAWTRVTDPRKVVHVGQELDVYVVSVDRPKEKIAVGLKQLGHNPWDEVEAKYPVASRHEGEIVNVMSYGAFIKLEPGVEGLVHISEMSWTKRISHPDELVHIGDRVQVQVLTIEKDKQEISLGMKQTQPNPWDQVALKYPVGTHVTGLVRNLTNYGAFIEIEEGIDGLLHVSDMSHIRKVSHPSEIVEKGQTITCVVINVEPERKRLALGLKQLQVDPWSGDIPGRYHAGDVLQARVTKLTNFGVFLELETALEGLLHVSELTEAEAENTEAVIKIGDVLEVKILRVDPAERKIGLSRKALFAPPADETVPAEAAPPPAVEEAPVEAALIEEPLLVEGTASVATDREEAPGGVFHSTVAPTEDTLLPLPLPEPNPLAAPIAAAVKKTECDCDLEAWLTGCGGGLALIDELDARNLHALASLVRSLDRVEGEAASWQAQPRWAALGRLLDLGYGTGTPLPLAAESLDVVLRLLAGNPEELFLYEALAEILPAPFVEQYHNELQRWLARHGIRRDDTRLGLVLLRMRSLLKMELPARTKRIAEAFWVLNPIASEGFDNGLQAERKELVKRFDEELRKQSSFFDRYDRERRIPIRDGSFALVIPVRERSTGTLYALKHYRLKTLEPELMNLVLDRFMVEADFLRRVPHPNVIRLHESDPLPDRGCLLLEWFPGSNLRPAEGGVRQPDTWWTIERVLDLGYRVASAFEVVADKHGKESAHNDLHPGNLMVDPNRYPDESWVKVIDFGLSSSPRFYPLSTALDDLNMDFWLPYRAPETAQGEFVAPASDVFALGVMLFQLLMGRLPCCKPDDDPKEKLPIEKVFEVAPKPAGELLVQMLELQPRKRPADWKTVKEGLGR